MSKRKLLSTIVLFLTTAGLCSTWPDESMAGELKARINAFRIKKTNSKLDKLFRQANTELTNKRKNKMTTLEKREHALEKSKRKVAQRAKRKKRSAQLEQRAATLRNEIRAINLWLQSQDDQASNEKALKTKQRSKMAKALYKVEQEHYHLNSKTTAGRAKAVARFAGLMSVIGGAIFADVQLAHWVADSFYNSGMLPGIAARGLIFTGTLATTYIVQLNLMLKAISLPSYYRDKGTIGDHL